MLLDNIKSEYSIQGEFLRNFENFAEYKHIAYRSFDLIEKNRFKKNQEYMFIDYKIINFIDLLEKRYKYGSWSSRDEKAYSMMKEYFFDILN
jgi:hypothetical protein